MADIIDDDVLATRKRAADLIAVLGIRDPELRELVGIALREAYINGKVAGFARSQAVVG